MAGMKSFDLFLSAKFLACHKDFWQGCVPGRHPKEGRLKSKQKMLNQIAQTDETFTSPRRNNDPNKANWGRSDRATFPFNFYFSVSFCLD